MTYHRRFGRLLREGIVSVAKRQQKRIAAVEAEIAKVLGYSPHTVQRWRRGYVPKEPEQVAFLVRYCVANGRVDRAWAQSLLTQARYPELEALLQELFPASSRQTANSCVFHNLPTRWGHFLGRGPDLEAVLEALRSSWPVILIEGMGGVGKTTLALEVAYASAGQPREAAREFTWPHFDYIVWTSAAERELTFEELLDTLAHRLNYPGLTQRSLAEKRERIRDVLAQQPVLLIVDDFETVTDHAIADFLVRVPPTTKVLLTGREGDYLLPPIFRRYPPARIRLGGLPDAEALVFLRKEARRLAGLRRRRYHAEWMRLEAVVHADDRTLLPLVRATEGNPKALALALGYIVDHALSLPVLVQHLYAAADTVSGLFDHLFAQAWKRCSDEARALWRVIPFFAGPARREALEAASGLQGRSFRDALEALLGRSLLEVEEGDDGEPRYRAHPLVRAFGQNRLKAAPAFEQEARERWVAWYADFWAQHEQEDWSAFRTLETERENILTLLDWSLKNAHPAAPTLVRRFWYFLYIRGDWPVCKAYALQAIEQATIQNEIELRLWLASHLGWLFKEQGYITEAAKQLHCVEDEIRASNRPELLLETYVLNYLGQVYLKQNNLDRAETYETHFLQLAQQFGDRQGSLTARYYLGRILLHRGHIVKAEQHYRDLVVKAQEIGWERAEGYCALRLAEALIRQGQMEEADRWLSHASTIADCWQDLQLQAHCLLYRTELLKHNGQIPEALQLAQEAHALYYRLGMRQEEEETATLIERLEEALAQEMGTRGNLHSDPG